MKRLIRKTIGGGFTDVYADDESVVYEIEPFNPGYGVTKFIDENVATRDAGRCISNESYRTVALALKAIAEDAGIEVSAIQNWSRKR